MDEVTGYYEDILNSVPGLPGIIYNIPQFTGVEFTKQNAGRLLDNPGIMGIKHTSQNLYSMERMSHAYPGKLIFNGFDEQFLGGSGIRRHRDNRYDRKPFAPLFLRVRELYQNAGIRRL